MNNNSPILGVAGTASSPAEAPKDKPDAAGGQDFAKELSNAKLEKPAKAPESKKGDLKNETGMAKTGAQAPHKDLADEPELTISDIDDVIASAIAESDAEELNKIAAKPDDPIISLEDLVADMKANKPEEGDLTKQTSEAKSSLISEKKDAAPASPSVAVAAQPAPAADSISSLMAGLNYAASRNIPVSHSGKDNSETLNALNLSAPHSAKLAPSLPALPGATDQKHPQLIEAEPVRLSKLDAKAPTTSGRDEGTIQVTGSQAGSEVRGLNLVTQTFGPLASTPAANTSQAQVQSTTFSTFSTPVGSPEWVMGFADKTAAFQMKGSQNIELKLNPIHLGPISINLNVNDNSGATAQFISHNASVRGLVEQAIPHLREILAEQGISLGQASVGGQGSDNKNNWSSNQSSQNENHDAPEVANAVMQESDISGIIVGGVSVYA